MGEHHVVGVFKKVFVTFLQSGLGLKFLADDSGLVLNATAQNDDPGERRQHNHTEEADRPQEFLQIPPGWSFENKNVVR